MSHLSDKELDRLSREAAEQNDVPQNTSGWDSLHLRLDKEMPVNQRKQRRSLLLLLSLLVLLTGSGLVYQYATAPPLERVQKQEEVTVSDDLTRNHKQPSVAEKEPGSNQPERNTTDQDVAKQQQQSSLVAGDNNKRRNSGSNNNPENTTQEDLSKIPGSRGSTDKQGPGEKTIGQPTDRTNNTSVSGSKANRSKSKGNNQKQLIAATATSGNQNRVNNNVSGQQSAADQVVMNDPEPSVAGMITVRAIPDISKPAVDRNSIGNNDVLSIAATGNKIPKQTTRKFPFSISAIGGADWTTVKFTHKEPAGYNAGLTFTWHFAKNFSVTTGAVYMKKNYSAYGKDYHPPKGYWTNYITLDEVNGSCWMIDIPLNLRYDFATGKKYSFFGSAGASTYLMDKESYSYHYWNNGNYYNRHWENNDNSHHIFSILNLSAGYEKAVSKNVSAQIEPYIKLPMSGIGFGNMQMSSYGLNFAIRYRPEFKKQNITVPVKNP